ncbi:HpcH/HpaI aldolase/citrate lyase family protein [Micrococcus terreus]|uniref:HpcH/HpaI aldolase/citrate lyase family protein n=1 Tax=Micrococcus terreus TaxID=574650 RepID=UPI002550B14D|nr:CoA ester lyase [Micrococcus terreus]MDK7701339.1 CoA ester lyase [Micrococcus terreus]WOO97844.1 CoA ester lyase [Micrococcus terreus]
MSAPHPSFELGPAIMFVPADRPDRYAKAAERADAVIIDLEDAVLPADRPAARQALVDTPLDPARTIVRVNPSGTEDFADDLEALTRTEYTTVMLAKAESAQQLDSLHGYQVIALCETALGVREAADIAQTEPVVALMWGAEDLIASLGGLSSRFPHEHDRAGQYRDVARAARAQILLAAGAAGKAAVDAVHLDLADHEGLAAEAEDAVASGFAATACLHPAQVPVIRQAYRPSSGQVDWATRVLEAAASQGAAGAFSLDGRMVDEVVLQQARTVMLRHARLEGQG